MPAQTTTTPRKLVVATSNLGKLEEIRSILGGQPVTLLRPIDLLGHSIDVIEDGDTFQANAALKARAVGEATGELTLADDSGLEVDALGGLPGVRSARFAGESATDRENNAALLERLAARHDEPIRARFRCAIALFNPSTSSLDFSSGSCEGVITRQARGTNGFGYDPLFVVSELGTRTMAELTAQEKNRVSHRARALEALLPRLLERIGAPRPV